MKDETLDKIERVARAVFPFLATIVLFAATIAIAKGCIHLATASHQEQRVTPPRLDFVKDPRSGLCFAKQYPFNDGLTWVPCEKVEKFIKKPNKPKNKSKK